MEVFFERVVAFFSALIIAIANLLGVNAPMDKVENFRVTYSYPTNTHILAINYLKNNTHKLTDKEVYFYLLKKWRKNK